MFFPEMNIYKKCSEKNTCMYFMKKDEKILDKDMAIWKKVSNITKKSNNQLYIKKLKAYKKMNRINIKFDEPDFEEYVFRQYKSLISINSIDVNEIVVSNKFLFGKQGFKYFIGYKYFRLVTKK